jgi:hypothetical protein
MRGANPSFNRSSYLVHWPSERGRWGLSQRPRAPPVPSTLHPRVVRAQIGAARGGVHQRGAHRGGRLHPIPSLAVPPTHTVRTPHHASTLHHSSTAAPDQLRHVHRPSAPSTDLPTTVQPPNLPTAAPDQLRLVRGPSAPSTDLPTTTQPPNLPTAAPDQLRLVRGPSAPSTDLPTTTQPPNLPTTAPDQLRLVRGPSDRGAELCAQALAVRVHPAWVLVGGALSFLGWGPLPSTSRLGVALPRQWAGPSLVGFVWVGVPNGSGAGPGGRLPWPPPPGHPTNHLQTPNHQPPTPARWAIVTLLTIGYGKCGGCGPRPPARAGRKRAAVYKARTTAQATSSRSRPLAKPLPTCPWSLVGNLFDFVRTLACIYVYFDS